MVLISASRAAAAIVFSSACLGRFTTTGTLSTPPNDVIPYSPLAISSPITNLIGSTARNLDPANSTIVFYIIL